MRDYSVYGPFKIPFKRPNGGGRLSEKDDIRKFFSSNKVQSLSDKNGVYIFAIQNQSMTPGYVGKTGRTFAKECEANHKILKYNKVLSDYKKGNPVMFFIAPFGTKKKARAGDVKHIESFFIELGYGVNESLVNERGLKKPKWSIPGVLRSGQGKPSSSAKAFRKMMKI